MYTKTLASRPLLTTTASEGCGLVGQPGSCVISRDGSFGVAPLNVIAPLTLPAVAASIVTGGPSSDADDDGGASDDLQPTSVRTNNNDQRPFFMKSSFVAPL